MDIHDIGAEFTRREILPHLQQWEDDGSVPRELHAIERCRRLGALALGYSLDGPPRFGLAPHTNSNAFAAVLLVNASRATKLWDDEHWLAVERWLADKNIPSILFWGSASEQQRTEQLAVRMQRATMAPRATIDAIASTLCSAPVVIGLDTGLTHLAGALGCPTVGIYCDYDPALVGLVGDASSGNQVASVGSATQGPNAVEVIAAVQRVMTTSR